MTTVDSIPNTLYISQRAANAIIAVVANYHISIEALEAINTFLDEFLYSILNTANSLALDLIKRSISTVLPTTLGKKAIQEAELELKTYVESGASDHTKERTVHITPFPLQKVYEQFRVKCQYYSTLGERGADERDHRNVPDLYGTEGIHIAPSLAIYLTAILEYVGEHVLIMVAKMSEKNNVEVARLKEVHAALTQDAQVYSLFRRMKLRERLQLVSPNTSGPSSPNFPKSPLSTPTSSGISSGRPSSDSFHNSNSAFRSPPYSPLSSPTGNRGYENGNDTPQKATPQQTMIRHTSADGSLNRKELDQNKEMRSTKSMQSLGNSGQRAASSEEEAREKTKSLEHLIMSDSKTTVKVTLTPNRLITIESVKKASPRPVPRAPVLSGSILPANGSSANEDNISDDELMYPGQKRKKKEPEESFIEFLRNTSPEDVLGNSKPAKRSNTTSKRGRMNKLEAISETPRQGTGGKGSTNGSSNHTPGKGFSSTSPTSPTSPSRFGNRQSLSERPSYSSGFQSSQTKTRRRPDPLMIDDDDDDDDDYLQLPGQRKPHSSQALMDFLATTPPNEKTTFNDSFRDPNKKKSSAATTTKFGKFFSRLRKTSFSDDTSSITGLYNGNSANSSVNTFTSSHTFPSGRSPAMPKARYIKIEIPELPTQPVPSEPSVFDQVEVQGRHARNLSKTNSISSRSTPTPNRTTFEERRKDSKESFTDEKVVNGNNSGNGNDMYKSYSNSVSSHIYDTTVRATQKDDSAKLQYGKNVDAVEPTSSITMQQNQQSLQQQAQRVPQQAQAGQTGQTTQKKVRPLPPTPPTSRSENQKELKGAAESGTVQNKVQAQIHDMQMHKQELKPNQGRTQPQPTEPESQPQTTSRRRPLPAVPTKKSATSLAAQASISTTGTATTAVATAAETIKRPITAPSTTPSATPSTSPSTKASIISSTSTSTSKTVSITSQSQTQPESRPQSESRPQPVQSESPPQPVQPESPPQPVQPESPPQPVQSESPPQPESLPQQKLPPQSEAHLQTESLHQSRSQSLRASTTDDLLREFIDARFDIPTVCETEAVFGNEKEEMEATLLVEWLLNTSSHFRYYGRVIEFSDEDEIESDGDEEEEDVFEEARSAIIEV